MTLDIKVILIGGLIILALLGWLLVQMYFGRKPSRRDEDASE